MEPENQSEMIERYILNRMSEEERVNFELLLQDDLSLVEEVKIQKDLLEVAGDEDFHTIYTHLKTQDKVYHDSLIKPHKKKKKILFFLLVLAFLIFLFFIIKR